MLTILFLGDVVGEPGRSALIAHLPRLKESLGADFIVVNGENAAGGRGITPKITIDLLRAGVSVVTTGDHIWDQGLRAARETLARRVIGDDLPFLGVFVYLIAQGKLGKKSGAGFYEYGG
jgi:calcineurin-like phosphoesterase